MQIKTTMSYHLTPVRVATINRWNRCFINRWNCWEKGTFRALLVGIEIGATTVKKTMEFPQKKFKNGTDLLPSSFTSGNVSGKLKTITWKNIFTAMFIIVLFTIAKIWKQPKRPSVDEWIKKNLWYIYTMQCLLSYKIEGNLILCKSMDGSGDYYAEWNKSEKDK